MNNIVDPLYNSIFLGTYNENLWKQIQQHCHIESKNQHIQDCLNLVLKLLSKIKKEHLHLNDVQERIMFQYFHKIVSIDGVTLGNEWNTILLERLNTFDSQIQTMLSDILVQLSNLDESLRDNLFNMYINSQKIL